MSNTSKIFSRIINYLPTFDTINKFSSKRVEYYGAQYTIFGIFTVLNYIVPYFMWSHAIQNNYDIILTLRVIAGLLCFILIIKEHWPRNLQRYLPIYWHFTILYCLPFLTTYMLLDNQASIGWLLNMVLALFLLSMLVDWLSFVILLPLGVFLGYGFYSLTGDVSKITIDDETLFLVIYMYIFAILIGSIFSRNRENIQQTIIKLKEEANTILETKVAERTIELQKALAAKTEFLNNISHEVRTPIHGMMAMANGLVEHWGDFPEDKRFDLAKQTANNAKRLSSLLNNLLDLSKFTAGKMTFAMAESNLTNLIKDIIDESNAFYRGDKRIKIIFENEQNQDTILVFDHERIGQVLRNLFVNAIKFTPNNGTIKAKLTDGRFDINGINKDVVIFSLKDEGIGIPENELEDIFEAFTQSTRTKTKSGGTGLGLSICREILKAHNGKIWAENNPNEKGAIFYFVIPKDLKAPSALKEEKIEENQTSNEAKTCTNILIIDDEPSCINALSLSLYGTHFNVYSADSGMGGLEFLEKNIDNIKIDIIFLDLMMQDMYGLAVLEKIKQNLKLKDIPVILQTGTSDKDEIKKAFDIGITECIGKPYNKKDIMNILSKILIHSETLEASNKLKP